jgi:hypothetical protein
MEGRLITFDEFLQICRHSWAITPAFGPTR